MKDAGLLYLQSYDSTVAIYDYNQDKLILGRHWDYSVTTLRHLYKFFEQYLPQFELGKYKKQRIEQMIEQGLIEYADMLV